ncbi:protein trapped in endoderm-1 [Drosophila subobscura]|uniref:protein trapped in endoderm-1 n=1 Tax=Drosophila subobscura TaxID=7241 RepID=UPI00155AA5C1|nr:protein trapped in endoderm-1 [Drosophila subobscura]XP_034670685.1 protein trapped in endoderm-1 [Drosophila subobscura]XP_034670694.1 protein trapped in endoderm-1 [Drosophila subobscura]
MDINMDMDVDGPASQSIYPHSATMFAAISACVFTTIGVLGNLITLLALLKSPTIREHATTAFVISLSISDLLFCSFSMPLTAVRFFKESWTFGSTLCKIFPVIFYGNVAVSLLSMVGITLNRYILIACHSRYSQIYKPRLITLQLVFVWAVSFLLLLPPILGIWGEMGLDEATFSCTILKKEGKSIKKTLFLIGFLLPCLVIIVSYSCIYITVLHQKRKIRSHDNFQIGANAAGKVTSGGSYVTTTCTRKVREDNRLTVMMVTIFLCFLICFLPLMLANVVDDERKTSYPWLHIIASVMAWASSVINPIIYAASNRNYRVAYYKIFALLKFWGEPLSPMPSRNYHQSKNSKELSGVIRSTPLFHAVQKNSTNQMCQTYSV